MPTATTTTVSTTTTGSPTSTTSASCVTVTPGKYGYVPPMACNANYAYNPSFEAAVAFAILFGIVTTVQVIEAFLFKKGFCWVMIMGCAWEFASFILRSIGSHHQQVTAYAFASQLLFLLAPLWINAYAYMTAGRLIYTFHPQKKIWKVKAMSIGKYFVWLDITSFIIQGIGGTMLSPGTSQDTQKLGKDIYMTGVGVQEGFIILFISLIVRFHIEMVRLERQGHMASSPRWKWLTFALYSCLALISMRIIYRLIEFSAGTGTNNPLPYHEIYALVLDATPMLIAITILSIIHPGMILQGPESQFPSRKEKKAMKQAAKEDKKAKKAGLKGLSPFSNDTVYSPVDNLSQQHIMNDVELQAPRQNRFHGSPDYSRETSRLDENRYGN